MAKFLVPAEMYPGVSRHNVGFFPPGATFSLPDINTERLRKAGHEDRPSRYLIPVDQEARDLLVKLYGEEAKEIPEEFEDAVSSATTGSKLKEKRDDELMTAQEAIATYGDPGEQPPVDKEAVVAAKKAAAKPKAKAASKKGASKKREADK